MQCPTANLPKSGRRNQHPELGKKKIDDILGVWWGIA